MITLVLVQLPIKFYRLKVMGWPRSQMAGMFPFESPSVLDSADPS